MFPDGQDEPKAHVRSPDEPCQANNWNAAQFGREARQHENARANQDGCGEYGVCEPVCDRVECLAQRLKPFRVNFVLERNIDLPVLDALIELAEVVRKIFQKIETLAEQLSREGEDPRRDGICLQSASSHRARRAL